MSENEVLRLQIDIKNLQARIDALLKLDTSIAEKEILRLIKLIENYRKKAQDVEDNKQYEKLVKSLDKAQDALSRVAQAKLALKNQSKQAADSLDDMRKRVDDVKYSFVLIARDLPYGLMGILNNIEMLTDAVVRLKKRAQETGQSFSALRALFTGFTSLFTTTTGVLALLGAALLLLTRSGDYLNRVTNNALAKFLHTLREIGKNIGFIDDFAEGFSKIGDTVSQRMDLENFSEGMKKARLQMERYKEVLKAIDEQTEEFKKKGIRVGVLSEFRAQIKAQMLELERFMLKQKELEDTMKGKFQSDTLAERLFPDRELPIIEEYKNKVADIQKIRDDLYRREQELFKEYEKISDEIALQERLYKGSAITAEQYRKKMMELNLELERTRREIKAAQDAIFVRREEARIESAYQDTIAAAQSIWNNLTRRETEIRAEIEKTNETIKLKSALFSRGAITLEEFNQETAKLQNTYAKLNKELKDIEIERALRRLQAQKDVLEFSLTKTTQTIEKVQQMIAEGAEKGLAPQLTDIQYLLIAEEELHKIRMEILKITAQEKYLRQEVYNAELEQKKEILEYTKRQEELTKNIFKYQLQVITYWKEIKEKFTAKIISEIKSSDRTLNQALSQYELDTKPTFLFKEEQTAYERNRQIENLKAQIALTETNIKLLIDLKAKKEDIQALEENLVRLKLQLLSLEQQTTLEATRFSEALGNALGQAIQEQIRYNSAAAQLERERTMAQIQEERRRIAERKALLMQEYEDILSLTNEQIGAQQLSQAEAARRLTEAEQNRINELEELKRRETELIQRENALQQKSFAKMTMANITNSIAQILTQILLTEATQGRLNLLTAAFVVPTALIFTQTLKAMLENMVTSYATGRMFTSPTKLGNTIVGDAKKAGEPINFEALLNASQLAEFGKRYTDAHTQTTPIIINLTTELNATQLVEKIEEQKIIYAKLRTRK